MIVAALVLLAVAGACFLVRIVQGPSLVDRVVAVDALVVTVVSAIVLNAVRTDSRYYFDVALVVAFVGFLGTAASARYIEQRGG
jgi:multisubunit Na+/H+ antiporter MnhF subunit